MRFIVTGADRKTGRDARLAINAGTAEEAEQIAAKQGVMVASVSAVPTAMATDIGTSSLPVWGDGPEEADSQPAAKPAAPAVGLAAPPAPATPPPAGGGASARDVPASARYHVIQNPALYLLETAVNKHMKEGWEPLGGIQVSFVNNQLLYFQALVRPDASESA